MANRSYSDVTLKLLWGRSGGFCAFPDCRNELFIKNSDDVVGYICHNIGLKGPRANQDFPKEKLNDYDNLILLCGHHHPIVDKDLVNYPVGKVNQMKKSHEDLVRKRMLLGEPLKLNLSSIFYLNVPRLSILASTLGYAVDMTFLKGIPDLNSLQGELANILSEFKPMLNNCQIKVVELRTIQNIDEKIQGAVISLQGKFRTKNVPGYDDYRAGKFKLKSDIEKDPHIHQQIKDFQLLLAINPIWITTTTAFGELRPSGGQNKFQGIAIIKSIDLDKKKIYATPLVIGIPSFPMDALIKASSPF